MIQMQIILRKKGFVTVESIPSYQLLYYSVMKNLRNNPKISIP